MVAQGKRRVVIHGLYNYDISSRDDLTFASHNCSGASLSEARLTVIAPLIDNAKADDTLTEEYSVDISLRGRRTLHYQ